MSHLCLLVLALVFAIVEAGCAAQQAPAPVLPPSAAGATLPSPTAALATPAPTGATAATSPAGPGPRTYLQLAYDIQSDRLVLWGGERGPEFPLSDTWLYNPQANTWTMSKASPGPSGFGPMAYNAKADRIIAYVSVVYDTKATPFPIAPRGETWAYDVETDTWKNMQPPPGPFGELGAAMAYDAESDRIILFGGTDPTKSDLPEFNTTWAYDYQANKWTKMATAQRPNGRSWFGMAYSTSADRVILFGGDRANAEVNDTWAYDFNADVWTELKPSQSPPARMYTAMVYDPGSDRVLLFGGVSGGEHVSNDTWAYDYKANTWTELKPSTMPGPRGWHAMAYSPSAHGVFLYGGSATRTALIGDMWLYDAAATMWKLVNPTR